MLCLVGQRELPEIQNSRDNPGMNYDQHRRSFSVTDQVSDQVTDQVTIQIGRLLDCLQDGPLSVREALELLQLRHRRTFMTSYLKPALEAGLIEMTQPRSPNSPTQKYRLAIRKQEKNEN